jgi:hypothetical protein
MYILSERILYVQRKRLVMADMLKFLVVTVSFPYALSAY